ncbi:MAG: ribonuclease Y [Deltaproteobacteria bacterium]|nr:ribonuclease Y [Deltaproteobacteria bacterium]
MVLSTWLLVAILAGAVGSGFAVGFILRRGFGKQKLVESEQRATDIVREAEQRATTLTKETELEIKARGLKAREELDREIQDKRREVQTIENRLLQREENLERRSSQLDKRDEDLHGREQKLVEQTKKNEELEKQHQEQLSQIRKQLERVAGLSAEDAKRELRESLVDEAKRDAARDILRIEEQLKEDSEKKAQKIISIAVERLASDYPSERAVSVVQLPGDEMKGRIIGREGRNIRALEAATGIDFVIDDTPEAVILSGFNPVRREIARRALEALIADGRIHPTRIEEMVAKATKEVEASIKQAGEKVCLDLNITNMHPELVKLVGTLKYRYSFAQNILDHSVEVAYVAGMLAAELGIDQRKAKRAALLHDVGKALTHEIEGSHALIGMEYAKKYREEPDICHAIGSHHEDIPQETALDFIVDAADALSGARPGARREVLEAYVKRLEDLERISTSFQGVDKSYAIQAGREVRILVANDKVNDAEAVVLAKDIAKKIETEMTYPGQIKVTVVREMRAVEYAK